MVLFHFPKPQFLIREVGISDHTSFTGLLGGGHEVPVWHAWQSPDP